MSSYSISPDASEAAFEDLADKVRAGLPVTDDSRRVEPGGVFVAVSGARADGGSFIPQALAAGAGFIVAAPGTVLPEGAAARLLVRKDPRKALGALAAAHFGTERMNLKLVGVTGTNGKTTTCHILEHLFASAGLCAGILGTVSYRWPGHAEPAPLTTPGCMKLHELLGRMAADGVQAASMEVSSHALDQGRVAGLSFDAAVLTNLTQDHLDYHGDMETYFAAKRKLFTAYLKPGRTAVLNADDPCGRRLLNELPRVLGYSLSPSDDDRPVLCGELTRCDRNGISLSMRFRGERFRVDSPLVGRFNAHNLLAAMAAAWSLGMRGQDFQSLASFAGVPGRLERVANARGLHVFVDYAHTPDALRKVLSTLRALDFGRIVTLFGCGGDRDRTKRPLMAQAVAELSDAAVLTSDNPRSEDPLAIMADARPGLAGCREVVEEPDRRAAIARALEMLGPGDVLLLAGKGHEQYQDIGGVRLPFDEPAEVRRALGEAA